MWLLIKLPAVQVQQLWTVSYTHLDVYKRQGIGDDTIEEIVRRFNERGAAYGEDGDVTGEVARCV